VPGVLAEGEGCVTEFWLIVLLALVLLVVAVVDARSAARASDWERSAWQRWVAKRRQW
jgi:hypothetical protein